MASANVSGVVPSDLLDMLVPGYSLFSRMVHLYLDIDLSAYSIYILGFSISFSFALFVAPRLLDEAHRSLLFFATSMEIYFHDPLYRQLVHWVSDHGLLSQAQHAIAGTKTHYVTLYQPDDEESETMEDSDLTKTQLDFSIEQKRFWQQLSYLNKMKPIHYTPTQNTFHYFTYKGCWIALRRDARHNSHAYELANAENILLYAAPWNRSILQELLWDVQEAAVRRECNRIVVYRGQKNMDEMGWHPSATASPRSLSTVILEEEKKSGIVSDIKQFLSPKTRSWYRSHCFPYRRGYLFHGPPGTGKSSMCFAIASLLRLDIYTLSFSSPGLDENTLNTLMSSLPKRCLLLFEDIDTAGVQERGEHANLSDDDDDDDDLDGQGAPPRKGRRRRKRSAISLSALLNILDGVGAKEGRILIMTTNHKAHLDAALLRPGRVDMDICFSYASQPVIEELFWSYYSHCKEEEEEEEEEGVEVEEEEGKGEKDGGDDADGELRSLSTKFAKQIPPDRFTPAEIQNYLFPHRESPRAAVEGASEWVQKKLGPRKKVGKNTKK
ncbi:hypothetical protein LOZ65_002839 [Ophidiomyces ophidiicola]|nr:hypothetical protein LOZ65_002839 [Ophidiomyces ophidiicola]